jgi:hypothetical protein
LHSCVPDALIAAARASRQHRRLHRAALGSSMQWIRSGSGFGPARREGHSPENTPSIFSAHPASATLRSPLCHQTHPVVQAVSASREGKIDIHKDAITQNTTITMPAAIASISAQVPSWSKSFLVSDNCGVEGRTWGGRLLDCTTVYSSAPSIFLRFVRGPSYHSWPLLLKRTFCYEIRTRGHSPGLSQSRACQPGFA